MLLVFTLPNVIDSIPVYHYSAISRDIKGTFTGLTLISVSSITVEASLVHLHATSLSNPTLINDYVAIVLLNGIDENFLRMEIH